MLIPLTSFRRRSSTTNGGTIDSFSLVFEQATPEQIGMHCILNRAMASTATVTVEYKETSSGTWLQAHPLLRIDPNALEVGAPVDPVDAFAGSIFNLTPGTSYDVLLTLTEAGQPTKTLTGSKTTRSLPATAGSPNKTITTAGNLQTTFNSLVPGDVLQLANGTYTVSGLTLDVSGTSGSPIYIRGESRSGVIIKDTTGTVLQYLDASHIVLENLTIEGSSSDSGTAASSRGIDLWNGVSHTNLTFRDINMVGVDIAFNVNGELIGCLVYNCNLEGNNAWTEANTGTPDVAGSPNLTWNDDGICVPGQGNAVWNNTLKGFGDSFAMKDGVENVAVYFYRNKILSTGDDACEGDYALRNCAFYDNYVTNVGTLLSLQPLWSGPFYCFRNICLNSVRGPFKLNATQSGFMIYNNTCLHANGTIGWNWNQANNGDLSNWSFRNNLMLYRNGSTNVLAMEATDQNPIDFTHNAWFPNGTFLWTNTGGSSANLAATSSLPSRTPVFGVATQRHANDVISASDPFVTPINIGTDHLTEVSISTVPSIDTGETPKNAGIAIPGITDGYTGVAPDIGAVIEGRSTHTWGSS